jgi:hypothetical protein
MKPQTERQCIVYLIGAIIDRVDERSTRLDQTQVVPSERGAFSFLPMPVDPGVVANVCYIHRNTGYDLKQGLVYFRFPITHILSENIHQSPIRSGNSKVRQIFPASCTSQVRGLIYRLWRAQKSEVHPRGFSLRTGRFAQAQHRTRNDPILETRYRGAALHASMLRLKLSVAEFEITKFAEHPGRISSGKHLSDLQRFGIAIEGTCRWVSQQI